MDSRSLNNRDTFSKIKRGYIFTPALLYLSYKNVKWIIFFRKKKLTNPCPLLNLILLLDDNIVTQSKKKLRPIKK